MLINMNMQAIVVGLIGSGERIVKILLVEDNTEVGAFLSRRLQRRGYDVLWVKDGEAAIAAARATQPDLLLMDMNLPVLDGWTVSRILRSDAQTAGLKIMGMSNSATLEDREAALEAGCNDHHQKPVDFLTLLTQITSLLDTPKLAGAA